MSEKILLDTIKFVKNTLQKAEGGHDWFHVERVYHNALIINEVEKGNPLVISLAALLHDIADSKFFDGDEEIGPKKAREFLKKCKLNEEIINHVEKIITDISFKNSLDKEVKKFESIELQIVQDADRLDAIGAVGIARAFNYGGFKNRLLYDPEILPNLKMNKEQYKKSTAPTLNHFYEKLLLLKEKMNTQTGKKMAEKRHQFMLLFLNQFESETGIDFKDFIKKSE